MLNLKYLRQKARLSQLQLAAIAMVKPSEIAAWEAGQAFPSLSKLLKLCEVLNSDMRQIILSPILAKNTDSPPCVPVYDLFACGIVRFETPQANDKLFPWCFAVTIKTDNLAPRINCGDTAFFCPPMELCARDIVLFWMDSDTLSIGLFSDFTDKKIVAKMCELRSRL